LGIQLIAKGEFSDKYLICSFICSGPVAQLSPRISILKGSNIVNAEAISDPTSIVPVVSIVIDTIKGISIFLLPPDKEELERRIRNRGTEKEEAIKKRLSRANYEISVSNQFDFALTNDNVDETAKKIIKLIKT